MHVSLKTATSSAECSRDKPPFSYVRGQDSTMRDIIWVSVEGYELKVEIKYTLCSGKKPFCFCITIRKINQLTQSALWSQLIAEQSVRQNGKLTATRTQIDVCKSPFHSAGTTVSMFRAKMVQQRPLLPTEVETRLPNCGVTH